jgi:hypothetical protein
MANGRKHVALAAFGLAFCIVGAQADDTTETALAWVQQPDKIWSADGADGGRSADFYTFTRVLKSSGGDGPLVILSCTFNSRGKSMMSAGFQLDPENTYEDVPKKSLRTNTMSGKLTIGDKRSSERFLYHAASSKIIPRDPAVARKLFNAVVKNRPVTLKAQNKTNAIALPPVDDVFKDYVNVCPLTNGGKMDLSIFEQYSEGAASLID